MVFSYFQVHNDPGYGNCYTFNHASKIGVDPRAGIRRVAVMGDHHGLQLTLFLDQENYMRSGSTESEGSRVAVMDPAVSVLPDEYGINVQPNTKTGLALHNLNVKRMPTPYTTNCTAAWNETNYPSFNESDYTLLVRQLTFNHCHQGQISF